MDRVVLNENLKHQLLTRHPEVSVLVACLQDIQSCCSVVNSVVRVWLPCHVLRPHVVKLLSENLVRGPNLKARPLMPQK